MTPTTLKGFRRLFFFTIPEAARLIATSKEMPHGVSEQRWREWESGESPIPETLITRIKQLNEWRSLALDATADNIRIQMREKSGTPEAIFVIWYDTLEDWMTLPNRDPAMWRLQQAVCAALLGMFDIVRLVRFDKSNYQSWLAGRDDTEDSRAEWASTCISPHCPAQIPSES